MKRYWMVSLLMLGAGIAAAQPNRCTQDSVTGTYAVASRGYVITVVSGSPAAIPVVGLALVSIDSKGTVTSDGYQSIGGQLNRGPAPGVIKVNADCTGTVDWGNGITGDMMVLPEGKELHTIGTAAGAMGNPVASATWKRISRIPLTEEPNQCSPGSLVGVYAIHQDGMFMVQQPGSSQLMPAPASMVAVGSVGYDGRGPASGIASVGGMVLPFSVPDTKFTVNANCTVESTFIDLTSQGASLGKGAGWGILLDGGNEAWTIETLDPTGLPLITGVWKRLSPIPRAGN